MWVGESVSTFVCVRACECVHAMEDGENKGDGRWEGEVKERMERWREIRRTVRRWETQLMYFNY